MNIKTDDARTGFAALVARTAGGVSRAWGQRGLGTMLLWAGRLPGLRAGSAQVEFEPGCFFELDPLEPYWAPTILGGRPYEPEIGHVLARFAPLDPVLVDCGANFGYWSIVASGSRHRFSRVLAIEPSETTFARLARNASLNAGRFVCLERAVSNTSGESVYLEAAEHHAVAHISRTSKGGRAVLTTRLDDAIRGAGFQGARYIVKMDVEGHELEALEGAGALRDGDAVFVLEDWATKDYPVLRALDGAWESFYVHADGRCTRVTSPQHARELAVAGQLEGRAQNLLFARGTGSLASVLRHWAGVR